MIDKNGKLLGLINAFDLFVILIIGVNIFFISRLILRSQQPVIVEDKSFEIVLYSEQSPEFVANTIEIGQSLIDETKDTSMGVVNSVELFDGFEYIADKDGVLHKASKEGYKSVIITAKLKAVPVEGGFTINGNRYSIGYGFSCIVGKGKVFVRLTTINQIDNMG